MIETWRRLHALLQESEELPNRGGPAESELAAQIEAPYRGLEAALAASEIIRNANAELTAKVQAALYSPSQTALSSLYRWLARFVRITRSYPCDGAARPVLPSQSF